MRFIPVILNNSENTEIINSAYQLFKTEQIQYFEENNVQFDPEIFYKESILFCILDSSSNVIAMSLSSLKHLSFADMEKSSYFEPAKEFTQFLKMTRQIVMNISWVTVAPAWRGRKNGLKVVDCLLGCVFNYAKQTEATGVMGYSRIDLKAHETAAQFGPVPRGDTEVFNTPCKIMYGFTNELKDHPDPNTANVIEELFFGSKRTLKAA